MYGEIQTEVLELFVEASRLAPRPLLEALKLPDRHRPGYQAEKQREYYRLRVAELAENGVRPKKLGRVWREALRALG